MTNEQQVIYLKNLQKELRSALEYARLTIKKDCPELVNYWGSLNTKALVKFQALDNRLSEELELLTPRFP